MGLATEALKAQINDWEPGAFGGAPVDMAIGPVGVRNSRSKVGAGHRLPTPEDFAQLGTVINQPDSVTMEASGTLRLVRFTKMIGHELFDAVFMFFPGIPQIHLDKLTIRQVGAAHIL